MEWMTSLSILNRQFANITVVNFQMESQKPTKKRKKKKKKGITERRAGGEGGGGASEAGD